MCERLAGALGVDAGRVAVRATTTDGLGFTRPRRGARRAGRGPARAMKLVRYADRPDLLRAPLRGAHEADLPGVHERERAGRTSTGAGSTTDFPDFQVALVDGDELARRGARASRFRGTARASDLPSGWDEGFVPGHDVGPAARPRSWRSRSASPRAGRASRLSSRMIQTFVDNARAAGLATA